LPNVHIGVVSSNYGQHAGDGVAGNSAFNAGCGGSGDDGGLRTSAMINGRFIVDAEAGAMGRNRNYAGTLGEAFSSIADVGTAGCGIEQHLASMQRALQNPVNTGFLRPNAKLAVIVIADEDDCSLAKKALFEGSTDGAVVNFRCTSEGVECDGGDLSIPGLRTNCHPKDDPSAMVHDVDRYVDFLKGLKPVPAEDVIVAGIVGNPQPVETITDTMNRTVLKPSCTYGGGQGAFPAVRTSDFLSQFALGIEETICGAELSAAMVKIGALLKRGFGDPCFENAVADLDPVAPGLQPDCTVTDVRRLPNGGDQELAIIPPCGGSIPCWRIEEDPLECHYTPSKQKIIIDRAGVVPPSDIRTRVHCVTEDSTGPFQ
jgi:hypothetical protein